MPADEPKPLAVEVAVRAADYVSARSFYQRWHSAINRLKLQNARPPRLLPSEVARQAAAGSRQRIAQGALLLELKEYRLAVQALREGLIKAPRSVDGWRLLGDASSQLGQFADALEAYRRLSELRPDDARLWLRVAETALRCGDYELAEEAMGHCRRMRENAIIVFLRGATLFGQRKFHEASRHFERALVLDATLGAAWWNLALAQRQIGHYQEVTRAIAEARRLDARFWYRSAYVDQPVLPNPLRTEQFNLS